MPAKYHLVIMARSPRLGAVKKRLAKDIGVLAALRFYRRNTGRLVQMASKDPRWVTWLAMTPDRAARHRRGLWPGGYRLIGQGRGDLGARMARIFQDLPPGPVVIVGSDIPGIRPDLITQAFRALGAHDWVIGPAHDGGYYLIGAKRLRRPYRPFEGVRWSHEQTLADTLANLKRQGRPRVAYLPVLRDVDSGSDLAALKEPTASAPEGGA
jgi:rSAM/selenodomain-associated transferase 1